MVLKVCFFFFQILQNLGKVDRTADDIFDEHLQNFTRQQNSATRLQKEFNNYIRCIRGNLPIATSCNSSLKALFHLRLAISHLEQCHLVKFFISKGWGCQKQFLFIFVAFFCFELISIFNLSLHIFNVCRISNHSKITDLSYTGG